MKVHWDGLVTSEEVFLGFPVVATPTCFTDVCGHEGLKNPKDL